MANQYGFSLAEVNKNIESIKGARENRKNNALLMDWKKEDRDQAKIRATTLNNLTGDVSNGKDGAMQKLTSFDPETANKILDAYGKMDKNKREKFKDSTDKIGRMAAYVLNSNEPEKAYQMMRRNLSPDAMEGMPEQYDPQQLQLRLAQARELDDMMKAPDKVSFGGNDLLYKDGRMIGQTTSQANMGMRSKERIANSTNATMSNIAGANRRSFEKMQNRVPASKTTKKNIEKEILGAEKTFNQLVAIGDNFSSEYLTYKGEAKAFIGGVMDKLGMENELTKFNNDRSKFEKNVRQHFNQYRKEITGAAAGEKEMKDLLDSMFNQNTGPQQFKADYEEYVRLARINMEQRKDSLVNGIDIGDTPQPRLRSNQSTTQPPQISQDILERMKKY